MNQVNLSLPTHVFYIFGNVVDIFFHFTTFNTLMLKLRVLQCDILSPKSFVV